MEENPSRERRANQGRGEVHHKTMNLLGSWIAWRLGKQYPRYRSWPEIGLQREVQVIAVTYKPVFAPGRSTSRRENWEVEEMGWAFLSLEPWKQVVICNYFVMRRDEWETFRRSWRISRRKLASMLLDLQDEAVRRGLIVNSEDAPSDPPHAATSPRTTSG